MRVTIGKYIDRDSILHSLDPRCKILCLMVLTTSIFFVGNLWEYSFPASLILYSIFLSRIDVWSYVRGVKSIMFLVLFATVVQFFYGGLEEAVYIFLRLVLILFAAELLTFTTKPSLFSYAIEDIMVFLGFPRKVSQEFSMMMNIAMRFAPIMVEEADRIAKAQISRGAPLNSEKMGKRLKALVSVAVPLLSASLRRAEELSIAMEARRYSPEVLRTRYVELSWSKKDTAAISLAAVVLALVILI